MMQRILIIDDECNIRMMMRVALSHSGFQVTVAGDGAEGLEQFGDGANFDLVLLDQRMPNMPGIEVQREIARRSPHTRVVVMTAFGTLDLAMQAIEAGAQDFVRKPFTTDILRSAVRVALVKGPVFNSPKPQLNPICTLFNRATINGFSYEYAGEAANTVGDLSLGYSVTFGLEPAVSTCVTVTAPARRLITDYLNPVPLPGGDKFWQALTQESLASQLWNEAGLPEAGELRVEELNTHLVKWLDSVKITNLVAA
jgi:CheY-like chemotaxis protein